MIYDWVSPLKDERACWQSRVSCYMRVTRSSSSHSNNTRRGPPNASVVLTWLNNTNDHDNPSLPICGSKIYYKSPLLDQSLNSHRRSTTMSKQSYKVCFCFRRRFRLAATEAPPTIKALFEQYSENGIMNADHLHRFLVEVQKQEKATVEDAQVIMHSTSDIFHRKGFNLETFFKYLFSDSNPTLDLHPTVILVFIVVIDLKSWKLSVDS